MNLKQFFVDLLDLRGCPGHVEVPEVSTFKDEQFLNILIVILAFVLLVVLSYAW